MKLETLLLAAGAGSLALGTPTPKTSKRQGGLQWVGVNEAGAEFGQDTLPGELGTHYIWPDQNAISQLADAGLNMFRVAFMMERLVPDTLTGPLDEAYLADLIETVNFITGRGWHAVLDPHNFGRYYGEVISSTEDFAAFWTTLASNFVDNELVVFDTNNEYHTMDQQLVVDLNQAAINAIRATGATSQYIFVEGNSWTGAWTWVDINTSMGQLTDPEDRIVYEMHQYLDEDGSGTHDTCVSTTIGAERVAAATQWLRENNKVGILGEFAGAPNEVCEAAVSGLLDYLTENSDVWQGALWWAAGPWWAQYMFSIEPPSGPALDTYLPILQAHI